MTDMHFIKGATSAGTSGRSQNVYNPATGAVTSSVPLASAAEVDAAVAVAKAALPGWANTPPAKRAQVMFKFRELIIKNLDRIAELISTQHGKTLDDAKGEVSRGLEVVEFACGIPHLLKGEYSAQVAGAVDSYSLRQPVGVVAGITPFNFPAMVPMWMFPMALACGNTLF
jgi:malonate-semialdehyde dehydrogenase (acetylating)/methylmalonate-semialdehyde dehydrogenase